jgi:hypothetical protein
VRIINGGKEILKGLRHGKSNQKGKRSYRRKMDGVEYIQILILILENVENSQRVREEKKPLGMKKQI